MPTISMFHGIAVLMFADDHNPPHFHVRYASSQAIMAILDLRILAGGLPARAERLVMEWAAEHRAELMENGDLVLRLIHFIHEPEHQVFVYASIFRASPDGYVWIDALGKERSPPRKMAPPP